MKDKNSFLKNIAILTSGTAIAQGLTFAVAPILSRLYSPEDFGVFSLYTSIIMVLSVVISLRYEQAIVIAQDDEEAADVFLISLILIVTNTIAILIIIILFKDSIINLLSVPSFENWLYWIPLSVSAIGLYGSLNYWSTRKKSFKRISVSQLFKSIGLNGFQIVGGVAKQGPTGLIGGQVIGQVLVAFILAIQIWKDDKKTLLKNYNISKLVKTAKIYKDFPLFSSTQGLLNTLSVNISPFFLIYYFGASVAGFYAIALKLIQLPISLIGNSIFQVFYPRITEEYNNNGDIYSSFKKVLKFQFLLGIVPAITIFITAPSLFSFILGEEWREAGVYSRWLIIWLFISFLCKPSFAIIKLVQWQKYHMVFEFISLVSRVIVLYIGGNYASALSTIIYYSLVGASLEVILLILTFIKVKKIRNEKLIV